MKDGMKNLLLKVKKLLSLANSSNENEAQMASKKAQELMMKHNLKMAQVEEAAQEYDIERKARWKKKPPEAKYIISLLENFFFVQIVDNAKDGTVDYAGTEENVQIAFYVEGFLYNAFKRCYDEEVKKRGWRKGSNRNMFYHGMYIGLKEQLEAQKKQFVETNDSEQALMVLDKKLTDFVQNSFSNLRKTGYRVRGDQEAKEAGKERGRKLRIARGMASQNSGRTVYQLED